MRFGNYSVMIPEGVEKKSAYVAVRHGTQYHIRIVNHDNRRCDAQVTVDGKDIGTFRLGAREATSLETVPGDGGKFTFYSSGSEAAALSNEDSIINFDKGLIQVKFTPEKERPHAIPTLMRSRAGGQSMGFSPEEKTSGGITGMSGHSDQQFTEALPIEYDLTGQVTISLRLVTLEDGPRPLAVNMRNNRVPPPV